MVFLFWIMFFLLVYNYFGYPILIFVLTKFKDNELLPGEYEPDVSFIIAAYNEEKVIEDKIRDTLSLDYLREKLEIIVVSDGSTDSTPELARKFADKGVIVLHQPERRGKTAALNRAVASAKGEIVVFSDANTFYDKNAIKVLAGHFIHEQVGGVCGLKHIIEKEGRAASTGDSLYWKYESFIKTCESKVGSIAGGDGEIFAIRKDLYEQIDEEIINDDAAITFNIIGSGYRVLYDTNAVSREYASISLTDDFNVKVRMVAGGFQSIAKFKKFLLTSNRFFTFQFVSHKILRWIFPELYLIMLAANIFLIGNSFYAIFLLLQFIFFVMAYAGCRQYKKNAVNKLFYIPLYFTLMNIAVFMGLVKYLGGKQNTKWKKAQR